MFSNVLIFGGTGSLGTMIIKMWKDKVKKFIVFSRSESTQWVCMKQFENIVDIEFILGDVSDFNKVKETILEHNPSMIIVAAAMKHVERCEENIRRCLNSNSIGLLNIIDSVKSITHYKQINLKKIVMVSTDKACLPINIYGMSKSICEHIIQNTKYIINFNKNIDLVCVRYGNVINSNGSIIPLLIKQGKSTDCKHFTLTDERMTRFYMTLHDSVNLINDSIMHGKNGEIWIPKLHSMKILDLMNIFSKQFNKPYKIIGIRPGEKIHESLISEEESLMVYEKLNRYIIKPKDTSHINNNKTINFCSSNNILTPQDLQSKLYKYIGFSSIKTIIILGSNGMLGHSISKYFKTLCLYNIITFNRQDLNITTDNINNLSNIIVCDNLNTIIINCIGKTNKVNATQDEFDLINSQLPHKLNSICTERKWKFINPSTDCVFSGLSNTPYSESSIPDTTTPYGISKLKGECGTTIRLSIIGKSVNGLYNHICSSDNINGYTNHTWNGVTTLEYAKILHQLIEQDLIWNGIRHIVPPYVVTKLELLQKIKKINKLDTEIFSTETPIINNKQLSSIYDTKLFINNLDQQLKDIISFNC